MKWRPRYEARWRAFLDFLADMSISAFARDKPRPQAPLDSIPCNRAETYLFYEKHNPHSGEANQSLEGHEILVHKVADDRDL